MRRLVIGSVAMDALGLATRTPADLDVFSDEQCPDADAIWHSSFSDWIPEGTRRMATLDELYTIKVSHSYWELRNGSWNKHMGDQAVLRTAGAQLLQPLHDLLYRVWEEKHGRKQVDLTMEAADFFSDAVTRVYDHDSLHESVAYGDRPIYEEVLKPGASVQMEMAKIWAMPLERQIQLFREEVYVTALERKVVPSGYTCSPRAAYAWALRRTITSLTKGRSAQFMSEHYNEFRNPDMDYVNRHRANSDRLRPYGKAA